MPYPGRPVLRPLPRFAGTGGDGGRRADPDLVEFVLAEYAAGRSLREIAELTDRSHGAIRYLLQRRGVVRRGRGAQPASDQTLVTQQGRHGTVPAGATSAPRGGSDMSEIKLDDEGREVRIRWEYQLDAPNYMGVVNVGVDPALDVEVDWIVRRKGQRDQPLETRRADLVPPGTGVWHNRTSLPHGGNFQEPREVMYEVRWTHPGYGRKTLRMDDPIDL